MLMAGFEPKESVSLEFNYSGFTRKLSVAVLPLAVRC